MDESILKALLKKATGYSYDEVSEEYSVDDNGKISLTKRKVTNKYCPPDATALKTYLEVTGGADIEEMTDEQLENEKFRLIKLLVDEKENNNESLQN